MVDGGGTGSGVMVVETDVDGNRITLKNTWQEIFDATKAGTPVFVSLSPDESYAGMYPVIGAGFNEEVYTVALLPDIELGTLTPDGYPTNVELSPDPNPDPTA